MHCSLPTITGNSIAGCDFDVSKSTYGSCSTASCEANFDSAQTITCNGNGNQCGYLQPKDTTYEVDCAVLSQTCSKDCFGFTNCTKGSCPDDSIGLFCFYTGSSGNYKVCGCSKTSSGFLSQCPTKTCGQVYTGPVGSPSDCKAASYCPAYTQCTNGNCALPGPSTDCKCGTAASTCIGRCCPSTGKCQAASCDGNKINNPSGHEHECVVNKNGTNSGGQCPWSGYSYYGVKCSYLANCSTGVKNNCWGYTTCGYGTCPSSAVGVFCIESGNSDNFKICGCSGKNTVGSAANCTVGAAPQLPPAVNTCANGNCAAPAADPTCTCADASTCVGKCCPTTGKCQAASCDGNKINNPSGHEHECVVNKNGPNAGGQCPWSGQSYGVKCSYLANCSTGVKNNCWGYTTCGYGTCPSSAVGVFCIESGNSDNFKICGCSGEGSSLPDGAAVAYRNCSAAGTVVDDGAVTCPAGFYCPDTCNATLCPCGSYCPSGATAALPCPPGKYCPEGSSAVLACPAGSYCPSACNVTVCPCGTYCPENSTAPARCPAASYCPEGSSAPTKCPAGSYCSGGACAGTPCPCGSRCPAGTRGPQLCAPPFYCPNVSMSAQALCPIGYKCPDKGMCNATACPLGTFVSCAGKVRCDPCQAGRYCPTVTSHKLCPAGSYCPAGASAPTPCPAGSFCHIGAAVSVPCPARFYCPAATSINLLCTAGSYCAGGNSAPVACAAGYSCPVGSSAQTPKGRRLLAAADGSESEGAAAAREDLEGAERGPIAAGPAAVYSLFTLVALLASGLAVRAVTGKRAAAEPAK